MKRCGSCGEERAESEFHKDKSKRDGLSSSCKQCAIKRAGKHYAENRDRYAEERRRNYDPERNKETCRNWREKNRDYMRGYLKKWREDNPGYERQKYARNPRVKLSNNAKRRARLKGSYTDYTAYDWQLTLFLFGEACAYCGNETAELEADHFVPLSRGGPLTLGNVVPACKSCNSSKGAKLPQDWLPKDTYKKIAGLLSTSREAN